MSGTWLFGPMKLVLFFLSDTIARKIDAYKLLLMEYIYIYVLVKKNKPIQDTFLLVRYIFNKFDNKNTKNI